ncbi:MAG TPA: methyltransferase domain-containing protein [Solirubrobacteraceae bacterium]
MPSTADATSHAVAELPAWYHTIELPGGVITPGFVDWRKHAAKVLPDDLSGTRALDVGTFDGFWAFEMEKRGAEVVAIDVDRLEHAEWPPVHRAHLQADVDARGVELGHGFRLAHRELGSSVQRVVCSVLDLTPEAIGGPVDLAFIGAVLIHLRDPVRGLERIHDALRPGGRLIAVESVSLRNTVLHPRAPIARFDTVTGPFNWWLPNLRALHHYLWSAGFVGSERLGFYRPPAKAEMRAWYCGITARTTD